MVDSKLSFTPFTQEEAYARWTSGVPGRVLCGMEAKVLQEWLPGIFGYRLVQVGNVTWPDEDPLRASAIGHKVVLHTSAVTAWSPVIADPARLPLASESIDLMLLPHTLDVSADPQGVLRDAERTLIPDGRLIIMSFNPWSLWGGRRMLSGLSRRRGFPWSANFIGYVRLSDWLTLLGLEIERTEVLMFRPPCQTDAMMGRSAFLDRAGRRFWPMLAGVYMVQAVKRVPPLTLLRPRWRRQRRLSGTLEPSTRSFPSVPGRNFH